MKIISTIFKHLFRLLSVLVGLALLIALDAWMQVEIFKKDYAVIFNYSMFNVVTGSMSGTIEINDYVIVQNTQDVNIGDIITFKNEGELITHRLVQINGDTYITRGDANTADDFSIDKKDVVGKVVKVLPKAGIWKNVISEPGVLAALFVTLLLFTLVFSTEERKFKTTTYKGDLSYLKPAKKRKQEKSIPMKIGFFFKKQDEMEENAKKERLAAKMRSELKSDNHPSEVRTVKKVEKNKDEDIDDVISQLDTKPEVKKTKKVKANLEALKK